MNRFLDLADFPREQIKDLLGLASRLQQTPQPQALAGKVLGLLFLNPSLRTLASFQSAMMRLGGTAVVTLDVAVAAGKVKTTFGSRLR